jgi:hypothetical protein
MKRLTETQIKNLRVAYSVMAGIPARFISLPDIRRGSDCNHSALTDQEFVHDCNSVGCIAGWLSAHPHFQAQGMGYDRTLGSITMGGLPRFVREVAFRLMGNSYLFDDGPTGLPGKRTALRRIREALRAADAITTARFHQLSQQEAALEN